MIFAKKCLCVTNKAPHQPLIEVLRQDIELYTHFKAALTQRLLDTPTLAGNKAEQNQPVLNILLSTLAINLWDVEDDQSAFDALLESPFIDDSIDNSAYQLQTEIEASQPLSYYSDDDNDIDVEEYADEDEVEDSKLTQTKAH